MSKFWDQNYQDIEKKSASFFIRNFIDDEILLK